MSRQQHHSIVRRFLLSGALSQTDRALVDRHIPPPEGLTAPVLGNAREADPRTLAWLENLNRQPSKNS